MPIIVQRQITQCLDQCLRDKVAKYQLTKFNAIKMPLLTANLFIEADDGIDAKAESIKDVLKFDNLTQDEQFINQAMKDTESQKLAADLLAEEVTKLTTSVKKKGETRDKLFNFETLMSELNTLMRNGGKKPILVDGRDPKTGLTEKEMNAKH